VESPFKGEDAGAAENRESPVLLRPWFIWRLAAPVLAARCCSWTSVSSMVKAPELGLLGGSSSGSLFVQFSSSCAASGPSRSAPAPRSAPSPSAGLEGVDEVGPHELETHLVSGEPTIGEDPFDGAAHVETSVRNTYGCPVLLRVKGAASS
jgi:hypothetical protein